MWTCGNGCVNVKKDTLLDDLDQSDSWTFTSLQPLGDHISRRRSSGFQKSWSIEHTPEEPRQVHEKREEEGIKAYFSDDDSLRFGGQSPPEMICSPFVEGIPPSAPTAALDAGLIQSTPLPAINEIEEGEPWQNFRTQENVAHNKQGLVANAVVVTGDFSRLDAELRRSSGARLSLGNVSAGENACQRYSNVQEVLSLQPISAKTSHGHLAEDLITLEEKSSPAPFQETTWQQGQEAVFSLTLEPSSSAVNLVEVFATPIGQLPLSEEAVAALGQAPAGMAANENARVQQISPPAECQIGAILEAGKQLHRKFSIQDETAASNSSLPPVQRALTAPTVPSSSLQPAAPEGNSARKELEEAINRIETHIRAEQAARRAAEGALAQAMVSIPRPEALPSPSITLTAASQYQLKAVLNDLANAQQVVQRAHALVASLLLTQQAQPEITLGPNNINSNDAPLSAASAISPAFFEQPGVPSQILQNPPPGAGHQFLAPARDPPPPPSPLRVKTSTRDAAISPGNVKSPKIGGGMSPKVTSPGVAARQGSPAKRTTSLRQQGDNNSPKIQFGEPDPDPNDRFATRKTDAFMLRHAARWDKK